MRGVMGMGRPGGAGRASSSTLMVVHIPKTAGTTFRGIIERGFGAPYELFSAYEEWEWFGPYLESLPDSVRFRAVMGHHGFGLHDDPGLRPHLGDEVRYATFLREPVARVVSLFNHFSACGDAKHREVIGRHPTIDRFLDYAEARNQQTAYVAGWPVEEVGRRPEEALRVAVENLRHRFDFVGITERFDASLVLFAALWGWPVPDYETKNTASSRGPALRVGDLTAGQVAAIREVNRLDARLYRVGRARLAAEYARRPGLSLSLARHRLRRALGRRPSAARAG